MSPSRKQAVNFLKCSSHFAYISFRLILFCLLRCISLTLPTFCVTLPTLCLHFAYTLPTLCLHFVSLCLHFVSLCLHFAYILCHFAYILCHFAYILCHLAYILCHFAYTLSTFCVTLPTWPQMREGCLYWDGDKDLLLNIQETSYHIYIHIWPPLSALQTSW